MKEGALGLVVGGKRWVLRLRFRCITQPRHEVWLYNSVFLSILTRMVVLSRLEEGKVRVSRNIFLLKLCFCVPHRSKAVYL